MITAAVAFDCQVFTDLAGMEEHDISPELLFTETQKDVQNRTTFC